MTIRYGITGNYYVYSTSRIEVEKILELIGKSKSSIYFNNKYKVYVSRIKCKKHKNVLKTIKVSVAEMVYSSETDVGRPY